jgi:hypothetical protein
MTEQEILRRLGLLVDRAENYLALQEFPLPPFLRADGLATALKELRDELKQLYYDAGGVDVWEVAP